MDARWTQLRFGRRLLTLFVTSALVPIVAMSLLSWFQVTGQLRDQSQERLQQSSKAVALTLLGQLQMLDRVLQAFDPSEPAPDEDALLRDGFSAVAFVPEGQAPRAILGPLPAIPSFEEEERAALARGEPVLEVSPSGGLSIVRRARAARDAPGLLMAVVKPEAVFDLSATSVVPPKAEFCVFTKGNRLLACSAEPAPPVARMPMDPSGGAFEWSREGTDYLAHAFSLFLAGSFQAPSWRVVLSEPRAAVLAPMITFQRALPLVALLSITLITLLCIRQIRARLGPFQALQEGTRRIARQDFAVDVQIESGDEFEELAGSFNAMARRLQGQFRSLTSLVEIDRAILEAAEEQDVVEAVLRQLPGVYPCDAVAVLPLPEDPSEEPIAWVSCSDTGEVRRAPAGPIAAGAVELPEAGRLVALDAPGDPQLEPLRALGMACAVLLPMAIQGETIGQVALGHASAREVVPEEIVYARRVTDQAAIAIRSIRVHAQNRVLAYFDSLTGLPNRLLFKERLEQALLQASRKQTILAVCLLDLDGFKRVNDTWGHDAGDRLLEQVAERIFPLLRNGTFARLGGDEFTLLLTDLAHGEDAARVTRRILEVLRDPFAVGSHEVFITASIGIAIYPEDGTTLGALLKNADVAMYHAKDLGRDNYQFFSVGLNEAAAHRMELEQALRVALAEGQLRVVYQPIFDPSADEIRGAEALLRWQHPELGAVPPSVFIPVAEETGLILSIGQWVLETAVAQAQAWERAGHDVYVAVNLSERQFRDEDCTAMVRRALRTVDLPRNRLVLELTESMLMTNEERVIRKLNELRIMGVRLAIDDFGTGYSSFSYLKDFPVQILKLDKRFIRELETSRESLAITDAMIALGHKIDLQVLAEGVENEAQLALLTGQGCDLVQGHLTGKPMEADDFRARLRPR